MMEPMRLAGVVTGRSHQPSFPGFESRADATCVGELLHCARRPARSMAPSEWLIR